MVFLRPNSGRPEVARRAGRGVAVLLKIYAHCIDGQAGAANHQRITDALGTKDTEPEPAERKAATAKRHLERRRSKARKAPI